MSVVFVICPPDKTTWHVDRDVFVAALAERWPEADVTVSDRPEDAIPVRWYLRPPRWLDGRFEQAGQAVHLEGDPQLVADHAVWFRGLDPDQPLVFVSDADGELLPLVATTTPKEVLDFIS
jgi:hypothetical protein